MMAPRKLNDADLDKIITGIAFPGYGELVELREIVDDCIAELRTVEEKSKYLPPTSWQSKHIVKYYEFLTALYTLNMVWWSVAMASLALYKTVNR